jgi:hypothetical protein
VPRFATGSHPRDPSSAGSQDLPPTLESTSSDVSHYLARACPCGVAQLVEVGWGRDVVSMTLSALGDGSENRGCDERDVEVVNSKNLPLY